MSYSQYFLPNLMDMGSSLGTILNYKRTLMSTVKGPLIRLILTVAVGRRLQPGKMRRLAKGFGAAYGSVLIKNPLYQTCGWARITGLGFRV